MCAAGVQGAGSTLNINNTLGFVFRESFVIRVTPPLHSIIV